MNTSIPEIITTEDLAEIIGVTSRTVRNLADRGVVTRAGRGKFETRASIRALLADAARSRPATEADREQAALVAARRREVDLRIAREEGKVIDLDEALDIVSEIVGTYRASFGGLAARVTRDVHLRRQVQNEVDATLTKVANRFEVIKQEIKP